MSYPKGNQLYNKGEYLEAIAEYKESIDNEVAIQESYHNIGICYIKLNEYDNAIKWIKKAISLGGENRHFYNLGYCYIFKEDYGSALFNFLLASKLDETDEETFEAIKEVTERIKNLKVIK